MPKSFTEKNDFAESTLYLKRKAEMRDFNNSRKGQCICVMIDHFFSHFFCKFVEKVLFLSYQKSIFFISSRIAKQKLV